MFELIMNIYVIPVSAHMLLMGVCNPKGEDALYNGLRFTEPELANIVRSGALTGIPVKTEHTGGNIGTVISSFLDREGQLQCVMDIEDDTVEGAITGGFVKDRIAADLSMGYSVDVQHSNAKNRLMAGEKKLLEISIVRRGARKNCHILAYEENGKETVYIDKYSAWDAFNMQ